MTQHPQWNDPLALLEPDVSALDLPLFRPESVTARRENLLTQCAVSAAISLARLSEHFTGGEPTSVEAENSVAPETQPASVAEEAVNRANEFPASYWANDVEKELLELSAGGDRSLQARVVMGALHEGLLNEGYALGHIGPSRGSGLSAVPAPPIPVYAERALMSLAKSLIHKPPTPEEATNLVHTLAVAVRGLMSVVASGGKGYATGVNLAQAKFALSTYLDAYPKPEDWVNQGDSPAVAQGE